MLNHCMQIQQKIEIYYKAKYILNNSYFLQEQNVFYTLNCNSIQLFHASNLYYFNLKIHTKS